MGGFVKKTGAAGILAGKGTGTAAGAGNSTAETNVFSTGQLC
jgi:hypothetical protein